MNSKSKKKPALGNGLSALLQSDDTDITNKSDISALVGSILSKPNSGPLSPKSSLYLSSPINNLILSSKEFSLICTVFVIQHKYL